MEDYKNHSKKESKLKKKGSVKISKAAKPVAFRINTKERCSDSHYIGAKATHSPMNQINLIGTKTNKKISY